MIYVIFAQLWIVIFFLWKNVNNQVTWSRVQREWLVQIYERMKK